jgi:hypothetical protein
MDPQECVLCEAAFTEPVPEPLRSEILDADRLCAACLALPEDERRALRDAAHQRAVLRALQKRRLLNRLS